MGERAVLATLGSALDSILDQVLHLRVVESVPDYVTSTVSRARTALTDHSAEQDTPRLPARSLPSWIKRPELLGPYERNALSIVLTESKSLRVIRGGSGSGKSSTHLFLTRFLSTNDGEKNRRACPPLLLLDLQCLPNQVRHECEAGLAIEQQFELLIRYISSQCLGLFRSNVLPQSGLETLGEWIWQDTKGAPALAIVGAAMESALSTCPQLREELAGERDFEKAVTTYGNAVRKAPHYHDALFLALFPFLSLAEHLKSPIALVLDNLDPVRAVLQDRLVSQLARIARSPEWRPSVSFLLPVRLTTFQQVMGSTAFEKYRHEAPDPIDIILLRLIVFILRPEQVPHYQSLRDARLRHAVLRRVLDFCVFLMDRGCRLASMLRAAAGSNLRNALLLAHTWCESVDLATGEGEPTLGSALTEFRSRARQVVASCTLSRMAETTSSHLSGFIESCTSSRNGAKLSTEDIAAVSQILARGIEEVVADFRIMCESENTAEDYRDLIVSEIKDEILPILHDAISNEAFPLRQKVTSELENALGIAALAGLQAASISDLSIRLREELLRMASTSTASGVPRVEICKLFLTLLAHSIHPGQSAETGGHHTDRQSEQRAWSAGMSEPRARRYDPETSRFEAEYYLLEARIPDMDAKQTLPGSSVTVAPLRNRSLIVNLFRNRDSICMAGLHALYFIMQAPDRKMRRGQLLDSLSLAFGYSSAEIDGALSGMVGVETRLLYSGLTDAFVGVSNWREQPNEVVRPSTAGTGYHEDLIITPAYLQWSLGTIPDMKTTLGFQSLGPGVTDIAVRMENAHRSLAVVVETEYRHVAAHIESHRTRGDNRSRFHGPLAAADVYFRSLPRFAGVLAYRAKRRFAGSVEKRGHEGPDRVRGIWQSWKSTAKSTIDRYSSMLGGVPEQWQIDRAYAEREVEKALDSGL